jgi:hypothetical protein
MKITTFWAVMHAVRYYSERVYHLHLQSGNRSDSWVGGRGGEAPCAVIVVKVYHQAQQFLPANSCQQWAPSLSRLSNCHLTLNYLMHMTTPCSANKTIKSYLGGGMVQFLLQFFPRSSCTVIYAFHDSSQTLPNYLPSTYGYNLISLKLAPSQNKLTLCCTCAAEYPGHIAILLPTSTQEKEAQNRWNRRAGKWRWVKRPSPKAALIYFDDLAFLPNFSHVGDIVQHSLHAEFYPMRHGCMSYLQLQLNDASGYSPDDSLRGQQHLQECQMPVAEPRWVANICGWHESATAAFFVANPPVNGLTSRLRCTKASRNGT